MKIKLFAHLLNLFFVLSLVQLEAQNAISPPALDKEFTSFQVEGDPLIESFLNRFLQYHHWNRLSDPIPVFQHEYVSIADAWLWKTRSARTGDKNPLELHKQKMLQTRLEPNGYVHTEQHIGDTHEHGWPIPIWNQLPNGYEGFTYGWYFQKSADYFGFLNAFNQLDSPNNGEKAMEKWEIEGMQSLGIQDNAWKLKITNDHFSLTSKMGLILDAGASPFIQIRWNPGEGVEKGWIQWLCKGDNDFSEENKIYFDPVLEKSSQITGYKHTMIPLYKNKNWKGKIQRIRFGFDPGTVGAEVSIHSIFSSHDTRHQANNAIYIMAAWEYFRWTRDIDFLTVMMPRLRKAMEFQLDELGGSKEFCIHPPWVGHDGQSGYKINSAGTKIYRPGSGLGGNYWDLMPIGGDDLYATNIFHASLRAMAEFEKVLKIEKISGKFDAPTRSPDEFEKIANEVQKQAQLKFWQEDVGRFPACIDVTGVKHDYGYTFINLEAIYYGIASKAQGEKIFEWLDGKRIVKGDTSTGEDIYHWRFAPRASTKRNIDWYMPAWSGPESIPWGGQIQDGGAVLGFSYHDLFSRLKVLGSNDAWNRLTEIAKWDNEVQAAGGYRKYYEDKSKGTLQGGGTAGGLGIDHEFFETSMIPAMIPLGFMGIQPLSEGIKIEPNLPSHVKSIEIKNLSYQEANLHIKVSNRSITLELPREVSKPIRVLLGNQWKNSSSNGDGMLKASGTYRWELQ